MKRLPALFILLLALSSGLIHSQNPPDASAGSATFWQASLTAEINKDYDTAQSQLTAYQQAGGDPFLTNLRAGWLYCLKQDYPNAIKSYNEAEKLRPSAINPLLGLLNVAQAQGDAFSIQKAAGDVLRADPLNYRAQMADAAVEFTTKDYTQALAGYQRVLTYYPDDMTALSGEAWCLYDLGDLHKAAADFQVLLGVNADYPYAKQGLALCQPKTAAAATTTN